MTCMIFWWRMRVVRCSNGEGHASGYLRKGYPNAMAIQLSHGLAILADRRLAKG